MAILISSRYHIPMPSNDNKQIRELIDRIARVTASGDWSEALNPTQRTALNYLAKANRFSRSPSQVADFMAATRGTVSQTLKALARKELVREVRSTQDKRSISYDITRQGLKRLQEESLIEEASALLPEQQRSHLLSGLESLLQTTLTKRGFRPFGICKTCAHHQMQGNGAWCNLLGVTLAPEETTQICHEHQQRAG